MLITTTTVNYSAYWIFDFFSSKGEKDRKSNRVTERQREWEREREWDSERGCKNKASHLLSCLYLDENGKYEKAITNKFLYRHVACIQYQRSPIECHNNSNQPNQFSKMCIETVLGVLYIPKIPPFIMSINCWVFIVKWFVWLSFSLPLFRCVHKLLN